MFEGNSLLTEVLLRQDLVVAIPVQPLCSYGWDGPCPVAAARGTDKRDANVKVENPLAEAMRAARQRAEGSKK
jgi:hypothetical protein